ncbi:MAG: hypothetical protein N3A54_06105 [Patescibacteria group bacterium]|nr:hypothetical protein [Patescibacteria group bacterium]
MYFSLCGILFSKRLVGIIHAPYQTYRSVIEKGRIGELFYIFAICAVYFALASLVKVASFSPLLLTKQFIVLVSGAFWGYCLTVILISIVTFLYNRKGSIRGIAVAWGYTLIPTVSWFFLTSLLYILFPPPRSQSFYGVLLSLVYLTLSAVLFFWKIELYYLTLRFGLRTDLIRIVLTTIFILPVLVLYSFCMYKLGIFRVPFL